ncbi:MAG: hypothetical protein ACLSAH_07720 [Bilophila wadsworthia]
MLHHLPRKDCNISLGYPLERSLLFRLLETVLDARNRRQPNGTTHWKTLADLVRHPYLRLLEANGISLRDIFQNMETRLRNGSRHADAHAVAEGAADDSSPPPPCPTWRRPCPPSGNCSTGSCGIPWILGQESIPSADSRTRFPACATHCLSMEAATTRTARATARPTSGRVSPSMRNACSASCSASSPPSRTTAWPTRRCRGL